jgi:hypothetical protein
MRRAATPALASLDRAGTLLFETPEEIVRRTRG